MGKVAGRVVRWQGGTFLVLFKTGEHRVSPRFYLFVSDVKGMKGMGGRFSCVPAGMERYSLDLPRAVKNIVGCESVWNS